MRTNLVPGFYELERDVANPSVDRRRKDALAKEGAFAEGMRFFVRHLHRRDGSYNDMVPFRHFDSPAEELTEAQVAVLESHLRPTEDRLGQVLHDTTYPGGFGIANLVLADLVDRGVVTLPQLREAVVRADALDDDGVAALERRHLLR